jgi:hypothetical protein
MTERMSAARYLAAKAGKKSKYNAVRTVGPDGSGGTREYDSKLSAKLARRLEDERLAGRIKGFIPEWSVPIGTADDGKPIRHRVDQLVIIDVLDTGDFVCRAIEAKGRDLPAGRAKRGVIRKFYGIPVYVTKNGELP